MLIMPGAMIGVGLGSKSGGGNVFPAPTFAIISPTPQDIGQPEGFSTTEGTFYIDITDDTPTPNSDRALWSLEGATLNQNSIYLQKRTTGSAWRFFGLSGGVTQYNFDLVGTNMYSGRHRIAVSIKDNQLIIALNGYVIGRSSTAQFPDDVSKGINIGRFDAGTQIYDKTINEFRYYNTALTEAQCIALTKGYSPAAAPTFDSALDVYGFMGDSRSSGRASGIDSYANAEQMKLISNAGTLVSYSDPYDSPTSSIMSNLNDSAVLVAGSYAGYFIDGIISETGRNTAALPINQGGSELIGDFDFSVVATGGTRSGGQAVSGVQQLNMGFVYGNVRGVIIDLGTNDANAGADTLAFQTKLELLITTLKARGVPQVVVLGLNEWSALMTATEAKWLEIRAAQLAAASATGAIYVDLSAIAGAVGDVQHYDQAGNIAVANAILATI